MADMAKRVRYLTCKGGRFYFRRRIPDELQERFGRKEITEPLGDVSKAQAIAKVNELAALWDRRFLDVRHELGLAANPAPPPVAPKSPRRVAAREDVKQLAQAAARDILARDEAARIGGIRSVNGDQWTSELADLADVVGDAVSGNSMAGAWPHFLDSLQRQGLSRPADPEQARSLLYLWSQEQAQALQAVQARGRGEAVPTPPPVAAVEPKRMRDAFKAWRDKKQDRPAKTVSTYERYLSIFERMTSNPPLASLTRAECAAFRDRLQAWAVEEKKTARTANEVLGSLSTMAEVARLLPEPWITGANPFERLTVEEGGKESEGREPWAAEELARIFSTPLFTRYELPSESAAGGPASYWVPVLAAFTGARPSEICQLWWDDLSERVDEQGEAVLVIEFRENRARRQRLKGGAKGPSWRAIPVHSELVRLGLRDYWEDIKKQNGGAPGPLFPRIPRDDQNGAAGQFGPWFNGFKERLGFASSTKVLYSFRHTVISELALSEAEGVLARAITGHAETDVHGKTYAATVRRQALRLRPTMERLRYPLLKLPRVYPTSEAEQARAEAEEARAVD